MVALSTAFEDVTEEAKLSLFVDGMILYKENPEDSTKKVLETIN